MNGTPAIGVVFVGLASALFGYTHPAEIIGTQVGFLVLDWIGRRAADWYVARRTPFDRNKPY